MGIAAIAGILLPVIIVNSAGIFSQQSSKVAEGLSINDALAQVRSAIKQANAVSAQYVDGSTTYTSGPTQLVLTVSSIDPSNNIIDNTFDYFVFYLDQNLLRFKIFPDTASFRQSADQVLSANVNNLVFQYFNSAAPPAEVPADQAAKVRATIFLQQKIGSNFETAIATSEANLRND